MSVENDTLLNMKMMGLIRDGEPMSWLSPFNEFRFDIIRDDNILWTDLPNQARYIITVRAFNNMINSQLFEFKFSEIDAIRILDCFNVYIYGFEQQTGSAMSIYINPNDCNLATHIIYLERIYLEEYDDGNVAPQYMDTKNEDVRDTKFVIQQYSPMHQTLIPLLTLYLSDEELNDLAFKVFFYTLIDIDLGDIHNEELDDIMNGFIYGK